MAQKIHINTMLAMLKHGDPCDIRLWTKSGEIQEWHKCISLRYNFRTGTRTLKLLNSNQIRTVRDVCIFEINNLEIFL